MKCRLHKSFRVPGVRSSVKAFERHLCYVATDDSGREGLRRHWRRAGHIYHDTHAGSQNACKLTAALSLCLPLPLLCPSHSFSLSRSVSKLSIHQSFRPEHRW